MDSEPVYDTVSVDLQVGGRLLPCAPMCAAVFSGAEFPLSDLRSATGRMRQARDAGARPLFKKLELWPLPELFEHAQPVAVWRLLRSGEVGTGQFQDTEQGRLVATDGWRLGTDPKADQILQRFRQAGLRHIWFTLAGLGETHDEVSGRPGAFHAIVRAMERCRMGGIETGATIIVSKQSAGEVAQLADRLLSLGAERFMPLTPFAPLGHERTGQDLHPEPEDLAGLPPEGLDVNWGASEFWANPEAYTEGALTRAAAEGMSASGVDWEAKKRRMWLWVSPDLEVSIREARESLPRVRVGNLKEDSPEAICQKLGNIDWPAVPPSDRELAGRYGNVESHKVYSAYSLRMKWLQAWQEENGIPWLPLGSDW